MTKKLEHYILPEHANTLYQNEALSSMTLAKEMADKLNEVIDRYNELYASDIEHESDQDNRIRSAIVYMKDNLINSINDMLNVLLENGTIESWTERHFITLSNRLDNLLGQVKKGSTSMDLEIIDARVDYAGDVKACLGDAIRDPLSKAQLWKKASVYDCNEVKELGHYFIGSSEVWANTPDGYTAGILIVYRGETETRLYQQFQAYNGTKLYIRCNTPAGWTEWHSTPDFNDTMTLKTGTAGLASCNLDTVLNAGMYRLSSSESYENAPAVAGLLIVYNTGSPNQYYQQFNSYDGAIYTRTYVNGVMGEWQKLATADPIAPGDTLTNNRLYSVVKLSDDSFAIYKRGANGFIKYTLKRHIDTSIQLDTLRIMKIELCNKQKNVVSIISDVGADIEGVIQQHDRNGVHILGVHGNELMQSYNIIINGITYTLADLKTQDADCIELSVLSHVIQAGKTSYDGTRWKFITFKSDGIVSIKNKFTSYANFGSITYRGSMFSINKELCSFYHYPNCNELIAINPNTAVDNALITDKTVKEIFYTGKGVSVRHWLNDFKSDIDPATSTTLIHDYGTRIKSYFNPITLNSCGSYCATYSESCFKIDC